jgi:hypothetical protein
VDIIYVLVALQRPEQMAENGERIQAAIDAKRVPDRASRSRAQPVRTSGAGRG